MTSFFTAKEHDIYGHSVWLLPISLGDLQKISKMEPLDGIAHVVHRVVCNEGGTRLFETPEEAAESMPAEMQIQVVKVASEAAHEAMEALTATPLVGQSSPSQNGGGSRSERRRLQRQGKS